MPTLSGVEWLSLNLYEYRMPTEWEDGEIDGTTWHELLRSFIGVKTLYICGGLSRELSRALELDEIGLDPGLLPGLQELASGFGKLYVDSQFDSFIHARQAAGLPVRSSSTTSYTIFYVALEEYENMTNTALRTHPLAVKLLLCNSPSDVLAILDKANEFDQSRTQNGSLSKWLKPTINVLYAFSETLGGGAGLILSPIEVIFTSFGVLLLAAKDVYASQDAVVDVFKYIESFFRRLEVYTEVPPTAAMADIITKIAVEVLNIFAIATKEVKQGRAERFLEKLLGREDMKDALKRLDRLTQEEARMAAVQILRLTQC
ncbi:hypothetical protein EDB87DRAFT_1586891 [Lactarius vividus]|nr:hypothetical protein EDB87DRAFT_1586891 [Lactarius vividus]